jgi:hypothetical protein
MKAPHANKIPMSYIHQLALRKFAICGGTGRVSRCLTHVEACNFSKLQYWGFIRHLDKSWEWAITKKGYDFLDRLISVPKFAITFESRLVKFEGPEIMYSLEPCRVWERSDYAKNQVPVDHGQTLLFA